jgi:hypothetical protein
VSLFFNFRRRSSVALGTMRYLNELSSGASSSAIWSTASTGQASLHAIRERKRTADILDTHPK